MITACYKKSGGNVRFINAESGKKCKSSEKKVTFNQTGPQGAKGAQGAQGERGLSNAFFAEVNDAFIGGKVAMGMNYFAFFPALVNPEVNPHAADTGFFVNPAGPGGAQHAALGGQGTSIISYISPERQEASKAFLRWFAQESIQEEWARLGGYTCNIKHL